MKKKTTKKKPKSNKTTVYKAKQKFIERMMGNFSISWPREMKIAHKLFKDYKPQFLHLYKLEYTVPSLAYFFTAKGKKLLDMEYRIWQSGSLKVEAVDLPAPASDHKIGENRVFPKRIKSIFDL